MIDGASGRLRQAALPARDYIDGVAAGDRAMLARAITLAESSRADHQALAQEVLLALLPDTGRAVRLGISGAPGVGKSTFIETFGLHLLDAGHRVAVLAIDPSSPRTGGSILGDKTRMARLSVDARAFIRPSPSTGTLGGVARHTREAMLLCEAAGFDVVVVETVGVGQSEVAVAGLVDFFLVLLLASSGDELQGIKRGILELADLIAVTKADTEPAATVNRAMADYRHALRIARGSDDGRFARVLSCSGLTGAGVDEVWRTIRGVTDEARASGALAVRRGQQLVAAVWADVEASVVAALHQAPAVVALRDTIDADVRAGRLTPAMAAARLLDAFGRPR